MEDLLKGGACLWEEGSHFLEINILKPVDPNRNLRIRAPCLIVLLWRHLSYCVLFLGSFAFPPQRYQTPIGKDLAESGNEAKTEADGDGRDWNAKD